MRQMSNAYHLIVQGSQRGQPEDLRVGENLDIFQKMSNLPRITIRIGFLTSCFQFDVLHLGTLFRALDPAFAKLNPGTMKSPPPTEVQVKNTGMKLKNGGPSAFQQGDKDLKI